MGSQVADWNKLPVGTKLSAGFINCSCLGDANSYLNVYRGIPVDALDCLIFPWNTLLREFLDHLLEFEEIPWDCHFNFPWRKRHQCNYEIQLKVCQKSTGFMWSWAGTVVQHPTSCQLLSTLFFCPLTSSQPKISPQWRFTAVIPLLWFQTVAGCLAVFLFG